jgi:hypothetical protein
MNKTIWTYWENKKRTSKPAYLDLCLETVRMHSPSYEVVVLNERTVREYLPGLREDIFRTREIAHRADYIRAKIVYEYGGVWLDGDIILLNEIDVEEPLREYDYAGCGAAYGRPSIWFFAANRHSTILEQWIDGMDEVFDKKRHNFLSVICRYKFSWAELGYDILWPLFEGYDYYHFDFRRFAPIRWDKWEDFLKADIEPCELIDEESVAVMLYNKFMFEPLKGKSRRELLASDTLLSKLFRLSLDI